MINSLKKIIKQKTIAKFTIIYLVLSISIIPIFSCGTQIADESKESVTKPPYTPPDIPPAEREQGNGGVEVEAQELLVEAPPEGCTDMSDCLAREEEETSSSGDPVEEPITDAAANVVWDESDGDSLWCMPNNPNTSTLKKLRIEMSFCLNREDALVIDKDNLYFQHFSSFQGPIQIDLAGDPYMDWLEVTFAFTGVGLVAYAPLLGWCALAGPVCFAVAGIGLIIAGLVALVDFLVDFFVTITGEKDCPSELPYWENADVGLSLQCKEKNLLDNIKISTTNSLLNNERDVWLSPSTLSYDLNIKIDPNCTTDLRDFSFSHVGPQMSSVGKITASNGGSSRMHTLLFRNFFGHDNPSNPIQTIRIGFNYYYFALE